jgi:hypothetical protein
MGNQKETTTVGHYKRSYPLIIDTATWLALVTYTVLVFGLIVMGKWSLTYVNNTYHTICLAIYNRDYIIIKVGYIYHIGIWVDSYGDLVNGPGSTFIVLTRLFVFMILRNHYEMQ